ncbi:MAG: hypothetical protein KAY50_06065 [Chitinophagaceae bacterium]|nr:hypothetical protein [Chitinophagaceae bacterium]
MGIKHISIAGVVASSILYAIFHKNTKTPLQKMSGIWHTSTESGSIMIDLRSSYTFDFWAIDSRKKDTVHLIGKWDINGKSINSETNKPVDAVFTAVTNEGKEIFNHFIVEIDNKKIILQDKKEQNQIQLTNKK